MEIQVLDVDYVLVDEKPIVRIFGKKADGKTVCVFYDKYLPYFYVDDERALELIKGDPNVLKREKVRRKRVMGYSGPVDMWKVTLQNPSRTPEIRDMIHNRGFRTYESDILFKYRFMNDFGIKGLGWIKVKDSEGAPTMTVSTDQSVKANGIEPMNKPENAPLRFMAFDIECIPLVSGTAPDAGRDPVIMISVVFSEEFKGEKSMLISTRPGRGVIAVSTEEEIMNRFLDIVSQYDPDVITGYNVNNFDFPYLLERMKRYRIRPVMGRCTQKPVIAKKLMARYRVSAVGRIIFDSFEIIKKDFSFMRYDLGTVVKNLLGDSKVPIRISEMEDLWKGDQEGFERFVEYCRKDSVLALDLVLKMRLMDKYVALSKISGTLIQDTLTSGETQRIENFLLQEFNKEGFVFPPRPKEEDVAERESSRKKELKGGFVLEPDKGLHDNVVVLDFKSMYPSIIRTFNVCPTTMITEKRVDNPIVTVTGTSFVPKNVRHGIIPRILEELMNRRSAAKKKMVNAKDENRKRVYDAEQWALKIMANAFYGHMGYSRARVYDIRIANVITATGRDMIHKTKDMVEREFGHRVVYGDTDSVMVKVNMDDMDRIRKEAEKISEYVTDKLPGMMELEFEKLFRRFLPLTKKRYVAWKFEPVDGGWKEGIEMKGIETVRRDWCELVSDTMKEIIDIIVKKDDQGEAVKRFSEIVKELTSGKIPVEKLVVTKSLTRSPERYAGIQPHVELVKKMRIRNPQEAPGVGDRVGYVIVKGTSLLSKRAEDPNYIKEKGVQVDPKYYIENQLLPPLERIFGALGVSKSELLGNGKQMDLMSSFGLEQGAERVAVKEAGISEMTGFVCSGCGRFYEGSSLSGACECGKPLLIGSSRGPVEYVMTCPLSARH